MQCLLHPTFFACILGIRIHIFSKGECFMDKKTTGLIATIATALLCGCPGLFGLCFGSTSVLASLVPGANIDVFGSNDPAAATTMGIASLCLSVIFIAIPIVVGVVTLRKKPENVVTVTPVSDAQAVPQPTPPAETVISQPKPPADDEPLPPAS
jgi:hypothetical protein